MNRTYTMSSPESSCDDETDPKMRLSFGEDDESDENEESPKEETESTMKKAMQDDVRKVAKKPPFTTMLIDAIKADGDKKGTTIPSIKSFLKSNYLVDDTQLKKRLKDTIEKCLTEEIIVRPKPRKGTKEHTGMTGRFKLSLKWLKQQERLEAKKAKKKASASADQAKKKAPKKKPTVGGKQLKSLQEKSLSVQLAQKKVKQARISLGMSPLPTKKKGAKTTKKSPAKKTAPAKKKITKKQTTEAKSPKASGKKKATKSPKPARKKVSKVNDEAEENKASRGRKKTSPKAKSPKKKPTAKPKAKKAK